MFYKPSEGHGLPFNPIKAIVAPRPIAWVGTRGAVDNLAPYSFFALHTLNTISITISPSSRTKDTLANIRMGGVFSVSITTGADLMAVANSGSEAPTEIDEFAAFDIAKGECKVINAPLVATAPAVLECRLEHEHPIGKSIIVFGRIEAVHIHDDYLVDGRYDNARANALARLGYNDYTSITSLVEAKTPEWGK